MSILGVLIKKGAQLGARSDRPRPALWQQQHGQLQHLLLRARKTQFGQYHGFDEILHASNPEEAFKMQVPASDYHGFYDKWLYKAHQHDQSDVCWPGVIPYYALSSGTSQSSSKYIPVTEDMLKTLKRCSRRVFGDLARFPISGSQITKPMLMIGSSTSLRTAGKHFEGDLSGIIGLNRPLWLERYYRPGRAISDLPDWHDRIDHIAAAAPNWDIGFLVGNPMWMQLIMERIIEQYRLNTIHDIWPNLSVFVHGGIFFEPYRQSFEQLLAKPVLFADTYMASEGFIGYQSQPYAPAMNLIGDGGIYFEFVPFNEANFDEQGDLLGPQPQSLGINQVEEGVHYALLLSSNAGIWRYALGDTVMFTDASRGEFRISGRTKQFLSVCGEHLSIDNLNQAVQTVDRQLHAGIREFTVAGVRKGSYWGHEWHLSLDNPDVTPEMFCQAVDKVLCELNDDYAVERVYALKHLEAHFLPNEVFLQWLEQKGKMNGQAKIPRVMKGRQFEDFKAYLKANNRA